MAVFNKKKDIFTKIGVINSLKEINTSPVNTFNSYDSISNDKDVIKFLLDISVRIGGSDSIETIFSTTFTTVLNTYDQTIKDLYIGESIDYNSDEPLDFNMINKGVDIPLSKIDDYNQYTVNKTDPVGELLYDNITNSFDNQVLKAVKSPNTQIEFGKNVMMYNENTGILNVKPIDTDSVRSFVYNYINNLSPINPKKIVAELFDDIFGNVSKSMDKTKNQMNTEEVNNYYIKKLINNEALELSESDLIEISKGVNEKYNGVNEIDIGCGIIENNIELERIIEFSKIDFNDVTEIENKLNTIIDDVTNNVIKNDTKNNIKNGLLKRIISKLKELIIKDIIFSPEKKLFIYLKAYIDGNFDKTIALSNLDFIKENEKFITCLIKNIDSHINEIIFNYVKNQIIEITKPVIKKILKERTSNYINIIRSLI